MPNVPIIEQLNMQHIERGQISRFWLEITRSGLGNPLRVPLLIARGWQDGPVLGVTAVVHGNALNGLPVVRQLFQQVDIDNLRGTIIGIPVMNMPAFMRQQRLFLDGTDLNQIMPGRQGGSMSEMYTFRLMDRIIRHLDYLVDVQTADFGQTTAYFVRADTTLTKPAITARLLNPDVILHDPGEEGTLRRAATEMGIHAITAVVGGSHQFQQDRIGLVRAGLLNLLIHLDMQDGEIESWKTPLEYRHAYWIYTQQAGILEVFPEVGDKVKHKQIIGRLTTVFGDLIREYTAPSIGIVLGKSVNPVCNAGGRILYLGVPKPQNGN
ncbi:MAG: peptidase M14 [Chloroflexi bacterium]|nr:MAG: peptidase M14 [Chloroflexota bacterium]